MLKRSGAVTRGPRYGPADRAGASHGAQHHGRDLVNYSTANSRHARFSKTGTTAFNLAESGINNAVAVLNLPTNDALDPNLLPPRHRIRQRVHEGARRLVGRTFNNKTNIWTLKSTGYYLYPNSPGSAEIRRTLTAIVVVVPPYVQAMTTPVWDWIYATRTGTDCDQTAEQQRQRDVTALRRREPTASVTTPSSSSRRSRCGRTSPCPTATPPWGLRPRACRDVRRPGVQLAGLHAVRSGPTPCSGNQDVRRSTASSPTGRSVSTRRSRTSSRPLPTGTSGIPTHSPGRPNSSAGTPPCSTRTSRCGQQRARQLRDRELTAWECRVGPAFQEACLDPNRPADAPLSDRLHPLGPGDRDDARDADGPRDDLRRRRHEAVQPQRQPLSRHRDGVPLWLVLPRRRACAAPSRPISATATSPPGIRTRRCSPGSPRNELARRHRPHGRSIYLANGAKFQGALFAKNGLEMGNVAKSDGPMVGRLPDLRQQRLPTTRSHTSASSAPGCPGTRASTRR